jgi:DNA-binding NarL/FixJ family response regulator
MGPAVRILVFCGNRLFQESITRILRRTDLQVIASRPLAAVSVEDVVQTAADVLVCDSLRFVLEERKSCRLDERPERLPKPVLVAMDDDPQSFLVAVQHGVLGYVLQEASAAEVVSAIRAVSEGEAVCPARFMRLLFDCVASQAREAKASPPDKRLRLTRREEQLIPLIHRGLTNKEIANQLNVSEQTVKSHVHRILRKAGAGDRRELSPVPAQS